MITYEILTVLRDTQLFLRPSGFDVQLVVGEGYLMRPTTTPVTAARRAAASSR